MPNPTGEIGQYQPGTGSFIVYGHAPIAGSPEDQRFTKETLRVDNSYGPSFATKVPGIIEGAPSNVYTTAGFENPPQIKKNK